MKKILSYILILIAVIGIFSPVFKTRAQSTLGICKDITGTTIIKENIPQSECISPNVWTVNSATTSSSSTNYTFLAPLPCENGTPGCVDGKLTTFDPTGDSKLGTYLNIMIKIFIGICAVLAVIMIIMGGLEYMTSELMETKAHGKHRIENALLGLVLAVGAWTLLYTINPKLLDTDLSSLEDVTVTVNVEESPATAVTDNETSSGSIAGCAEGIVGASGISVCGSIANNVSSLITKARNENISLSGGGYRSAATQTQLRIKNCNGDTTSPKPNPPCNPPTALPGTSRHTFGLAIDFKCDGALIQSRDNKCFLWLKANAGAFGLSNLSSEPWHWSDNGR